MAACKMTLFACFLLGSAVAYTLLTVLYRLHIQPLSRFPGPRLAAITGLYEVYYAAWGAGSFGDEIERMHRLYGPVVRITPDELHIQEQHAYTTNYADGWIKGTAALDTRHHHSGRKTRGFPIRKRSISRVRSLLQVEAHQIIRGLVQKHHFHRILSSKIRPLFPKPDLPMICGGDAIDLEDGDHGRLLSPRSSSSRS